MFRRKKKERKDDQLTDSDLPSYHIVEIKDLSSQDEPRYIYKVVPEDLSLSLEEHATQVVKELDLDEYVELNLWFYSSEEETKRVHDLGMARHQYGEFLKLVPGRGSDVLLFDDLGFFCDESFKEWKECYNEQMCVHYGQMKGSLEDILGSDRDEDLSKTCTLQTSLYKHCLWTSRDYFPILKLLEEKQNKVFKKGLSCW